MNGSAWADSLKKSYSEEGLSHFFSWHYNLIAKRNRFEVLELMMDEKVEKSRILPIYKRVFKEIEDLNISPEINQWIELEGNFINACVNILERPRERNLYREEIESNKQGWLKLVRSQYDKLFSAFADNNSKLMLELIAPLQQYSSIPVELKLLGMWSELKEQGSQFSQDKLKEWQVQLLRLPIPQQFIYLKKINEGLIAKHTGQKPVARRLFLEAKKYNTECKIPDFEIRYLSHPEKQWPQWFNKTSAFIKKIQKNRVYPNN